ncbi:hypothetical protein EVA_21967 [gut metagenome]|uniref:Uncharacterized protein n=1 Tax=gut metagenome TaxID=749906 RepID=J9F616_9ZZZZ
MRARNPAGIMRTKTSFQFTFILPVHCVILFTIKRHLHRNRILSFFRITYHIQIMLACIKKIQAIGRILHPVRIRRVRISLLLHLLQFLCENMIRILPSIKAKVHCFIIIQERKCKILVRHCIRFLRISSNLTKQFLIIKQQSFFLLGRIHIIILLTIPCGKRIVKTIRIINKSWPDFRG